MLGFMDGANEISATTPSDMFFLLLCPHCYDIVSNAKVEQGGSAQEFARWLRHVAVKVLTCN
jgi:hypothetical protein